jgi:quercetin dioxygenase-like cupin family protein
MKIQSWQDLEWEELAEGLSRKIITGLNVMCAQVRLEKGVLVSEHAHHNEQISYVLQGAMKFGVPGEELIVRAGQVLVIPPNIPHRVEALEPSLVLDTFSPIRQDWLDGTDSYLRQAAPKK